ncbi:MAG: DUF4350 domain-containing protein [Candidatus Eisenbacteria bacterium]
MCRLFGLVEGQVIPGLLNGYRPLLSRNRRSPRENLVTPLLCIALALASLPTLLLSHSPAYAGEPEPISVVDVVIFDDSREQFWQPFDPGFFGYSELGIALREAGFLVTESNFPLNHTLPTVNPRGSVLVLGPASHQRYDPKEISAVEEYVNKGGGLLILAEPDVFGSENFQNALASKFGMRFLNGEVLDTVNSQRWTAGRWIFGTSPFFGIDRVALPVPLPMIVAGSAFPILTGMDTLIPNKATLGAAVERGQGRVVCIGDSQLFINGGNEDIGIDCGNNRAFAMAVFRWLARHKTPRSVTIAPEYTVLTGSTINLTVRVDKTTDLVAHVDGGQIDPDTVLGASGELIFRITVEKDGYVEFVAGDGTRKTVVFFSPPSGGMGAKLLFDTRGFAPEMADPLNGLMGLASVLRDKGFWVWAVEDGLVHLKGLHAIIVVNPLRSGMNLYVGDVHDPRQRWAIIGEPYTTVAVHNSVGEWLRERGFRDREIPVDSLARQFEMSFLPYQIFEDDDSRTLGRHPTFPILSFGVEDCNAFRCGIVQANDGMPVIQGSESAWGLEGGLGLRSEGTKIKAGQFDYKNRPAAAIVGYKVVAIADLHILSGQHLMERGNWAFALELMDWLAGVEFKVP